MGKRPSPGAALRHQVLATQARERDEDLRVIDRFTAGQVFRHITIRDTYSTAEVIEVNPESGKVKLRLTKRGSSNRWVMEVGAATLLKYTPAAVLLARIFLEIVELS